MSVPGDVANPTALCSKVDGSVPRCLAKPSLAILKAVLRVLAGHRRLSCPRFPSECLAERAPHGPVPIALPSSQHHTSANRIHQALVQGVLVQREQYDFGVGQDPSSTGWQFRRRLIPACEDPELTGQAEGNRREHGFKTLSSLCTDFNSRLLFEKGSDRSTHGSVVICDKYTLGHLEWVPRGFHARHGAAPALF